MNKGITRIKLIYCLDCKEQSAGVKLKQLVPFKPFLDFSSLKESQGPQSTQLGTCLSSQGSLPQNVTAEALRTPGQSKYEYQAMETLVLQKSSPSLG